MFLNKHPTSKYCVPKLLTDNIPSHPQTTVPLSQRERKVTLPADKRFYKVPERAYARAFIVKATIENTPANQKPDPNLDYFLPNEIPVITYHRK